MKTGRRAGVIVKYKGEIPTLLLRVRSKDEAKRLIWALESLAAEFGYKFHADLGLFGSPLSAGQREALGIPNGHGLLLRMVYRDGPGEKAGLRAGDVIIFIGKEPIRDGGSFSKAYAGKKVWQMFRREGGYGDYQLVSVKVDFPQVGGAPQTAQGVEDYWFMPTRMASAEQAIGVIKNLQQDIVGLSGWHIDDFEVDQFGMRAKGKDAMFITAFADDWTHGLGEFKEYVKGFTPEKVEKITWVKANTIERLAVDLAKPKTSLLLHTGLEYTNSGVQNIRALLIFWALVGNLDRPGGLVFRMPQTSPIRRNRIEPPLRKPVIGSDRHPLYGDLNRSGHFLEVPRAILKGDPYPVKGLMVLGGSIITAFPSPELWRRSFQALECLLVIDRFR